MSTELSIVRPENVQMIAQQAPQIYDSNKKRSERCIEAGSNLIVASKAKEMTDDMDREFAAYLEKTRKTLKLMNEQRAPITKLFDQIRAEFTGMENSIDVSKKDSVPFKIQQMRNAFAAKKREEEERRRREEMIKLQKQQAMTKYEQDIEEAYKTAYNSYIAQCINELTSLNAGLSLDNYDEQSAKIIGYPTTPNDKVVSQVPMVYLPQLVSQEEANTIRAKVQSWLFPQLNEQFQSQVGDFKNSVVDALPSKKRELERIASANKEEAERIKAELAAKEAAEAARLEEERKRKEEEAKAAKEMQVQAQQMGDLFNAASVGTPTYQPKTSVKKRVVALDAEGIINIVSFWWSKDGQFMDVEDLVKMFKKQITAVEKYANDKAHPEFISSTHVKYEDEVKAK